MNVPIEISFREMDRSAELSADILERVKQLDATCSRIMQCHVIVEAFDRQSDEVTDQSRPGTLYRVEIRLCTPNHEFVVGREEFDSYLHKDPSIAVRDSFAAICRLIEEFPRDEHAWSEAGSHHGKIARICLPDGAESLESGYGYISICDGREVYFDAKSLDDVDFHRLELGSEVEFTEEERDDGPCVKSMRPVGKRISVE